MKPSFKLQVSGFRPKKLGLSEEAVRRAHLAELAVAARNESASANEGSQASAPNEEFSVTSNAVIRRFDRA